MGLDLGLVVFWLDNFVLGVVATGSGFVPELVDGVVKRIGIDTLDVHVVVGKCLGAVVVGKGLLRGEICKIMKN
jgi:hypothetical protein